MKRYGCMLLCGVVCVLGMAGCPVDKQAQTKILFRTDRDGDDEIYLMDVDGGGITNLTREPLSNDGAAPLPDGSAIVYNSAPSWQDSSLMLVNPDGTGAVTLVADGGYNWDVRFTDDASRMVFVTEGQPASRLRSVRLDAMDLLNLTDGSSAVWDVAVRPHGMQVAYVSQANGNSEIYVTGVAGGPTTNLTANAASDSNPAYSPDGSRIAFVSDRSGNRDIYVMNADGTNPVNVSNTPAQSGKEAQFSPDGKKLLWTSKSGNTTMSVVVANLDGSGQVQLTDMEPGQPAGCGDDRRRHLGRQCRRHGVEESDQRDGTGFVSVLEPGWEEDRLPGESRWQHRDLQHES
jgi:Tol biopolymer transport system component